MNEVTPLKPSALLAALLGGGVQFVVVGGIAVIAHGFVRATKDVDIMPAPDRENLERMLAVLEEIAAEPLALADFGPEEILELSLENLELGGNWLLRTKYGRLDVMQYVEGVADYESIRPTAVAARSKAIPPGTLIAGLDDLIAMKAAAGRPQDLLDIEALERARGHLP